MKFPVALAGLLMMLCRTASFTSSGCPPENFITPHCWCRDMFYGGSMFCKEILSPRDLQLPIEACQDRNVTGLNILDSTLQYLPSGIFHKTKFERIAFTNTQLISLSNGPLAFEGLEDSLEELRAIQNQYSAQWRFSQLRHLKELRLIDINNILMESLSEKLPPFPKLETFGLIKAGVSYLDDELFADCHQLRLLDVRENDIHELKRSMLPNPASRLEMINLQSNQLESLPSDFFEQMPALTDLFLGKNKIFTLNQATFEWVYSNVTTLDLGENPLHCDCRMQWLVGKRIPHYLHATCQEPPSLKGISIRYLSNKNLWC